MYKKGMAAFKKFMSMSCVRLDPTRIIRLLLVMCVVMTSFYYGEITERSRRLYAHGINTLQVRADNCTNIEFLNGNSTIPHRMVNFSLTVPNSSYNSNMKSNEIKNRLETVRTKCLRYTDIPYWKNLQHSGTIWTYGNLNYCIIPKVGCTFWKRILRFVSKDYPLKGDVHKPSDIDRTYVHYGGLSNIRRTSVKDPIARTIIGNNAFMFTRDPYTRLWSAYIDKLLLPDFWRTDALDIIKRIRPNATQYELQCANTVTFQEFLMFVNLTSRGNMNEHWERIHKICSPCHISFDVIGKLETFAPDAEYIMSRYHLDYLQENTTKLNMVTEEIKTLTSYNFKLEDAVRKGCFDKMDVAQRLWKTFQYNGYIHRDTKFPKEQLEESMFLSNPIKTFVKLVLNVINNKDDKRLEMKSQKRTMMLEAYRNVPAELLASITEVYEYDFELFDYNKTLFT